MKPRLWIRSLLCSLIPSKNSMNNKPKLTNLNLNLTNYYFKLNKQMRLVIQPRPNYEGHMNNDPFRQQTLDSYTYIRFYCQAEQQQNCNKCRKLLRHRQGKVMANADASKALFFSNYFVSVCVQAWKWKKNSPEVQLARYSTEEMGVEGFRERYLKKIIIIKTDPINFNTGIRAKAAVKLVNEILKS